MTTIELIKVVEKYRPDGIAKGAEFLLPPEKAISLVDDLAQNGVLVVGCDLWRYLDKDKSWIVALLGAGMGIDTPPDETTVERNADIIKEFLSKQLPNDAELVSLIFEDSAIHDLFIP